jgi:hypothetical protein
MTMRTRLKRLERLAPPAPEKPKEPVDQFIRRPEVKAALEADSEYVAASRAAYLIVADALESEAERPPADFLPGWPDAKLLPARLRRNPDIQAWLKRCRPEAERIWQWLARKPGFNGDAWLRERRPDYVPAMVRWATAMEAVLQKEFGYRTGPVRVPTSSDLALAVHSSAGPGR